MKSQSEIKQYLEAKGCRIRTATEFYGTEHSGLRLAGFDWNKKVGKIEGTDIDMDVDMSVMDLDYLMGETVISFNEEIDNWLENAGWMAEPYDSGTLIIFQQ